MCEQETTAAFRGAIGRGGGPSGEGVGLRRPGVNRTQGPRQGQRGGACSWANGPSPMLFLSQVPDAHWEGYV